MRGFSKKTPPERVGSAKHNKVNVESLLGWISFQQGTQMFFKEILEHKLFCVYHTRTVTMDRVILFLSEILLTYMGNEMRESSFL